MSIMIDAKGAVMIDVKDLTLEDGKLVPKKKDGLTTVEDPESEFLVDMFKKAEKASGQLREELKQIKEDFRNVGDDSDEAIEELEAKIKAKEAEIEEIEKQSMIASAEEAQKNPPKKHTNIRLTCPDGKQEEFDLFNDADFACIAQKFMYAYPKEWAKAFTLYAECWETFKGDHPDLEVEMPKMGVLPFKDCWGCLIPDPADKDHNFRMLLNVIALVDDTVTKDVIYHELCHIIYHEATEDNAGGHPREFYDELEKYDSVYKQQRADQKKRAQEKMANLLKQLEEEDYD